MHPKGVLFDLNGTLLIYGDMKQAWADWLSAVNRNLQRLGLELSGDELDHLCRGFFSRDEPEADDDGLTVYERRLQTLVRSLGIAADPADLRAMADLSAAAWQHHVRIDPSAHELLSLLRRKVSLGLVTNFDHPPHIERVLADFDLTDFFDTVTVSGSVGVKKPDPEILWQTLKVLGLRPDETVFVGDAPEDIEAAVEAGVTPIRIARDPDADSSGRADYTAPSQDWDRYPSDYVRVSSLRDLVPLLTSD